MRPSATTRRKVHHAESARRPSSRLVRETQGTLEELPTKHVSGSSISDHEVEEVVPGLLEDADAALRELREAIDAMQSAKRALTDLRRGMGLESGDR